MNWNQIEALMDAAKQVTPPSHLSRLQIASNGRPDPYYNFMALLAQCYDIGAFLEIGCYLGGASAHISSITDKKSIAIDKKPIWLPYDSFKFYHGLSSDYDAVEFVKKESGGKLFAVFQDSSHFYEDSKTEWGLYSPFVVPGGLWICDDITPAFKDDKGKTMVEYFEELPGDKRLYENLHIGSTIGIVRL